MKIFTIKYRWDVYPGAENTKVKTVQAHDKKHALEIAFTRALPPPIIESIEDDGFKMTDIGPEPEGLASGMFVKA